MSAVFVLPRVRQCAVESFGQDLFFPTTGGGQFSVRIMTKSAEFYLRALECSRLAKATASLEDKQAWLKLAQEWDKLARDEDRLQKEWKDWMDLQAKWSITDKRNKHSSAP
jgi:hypothetical protein